MRILILFLNIILCSCESIDLGSSESENIVNDLTYLRAGETLGTGISSSGSSRNFISCTSTMAKVIPSFLRSYEVAFGGFVISSSISTCGQCSSFKFSCNPGETISIGGTYYLSQTFVGRGVIPGSFIEPNDFDTSSITKDIIISKNIVCSDSGIAESGDIFPSAVAYMKVTVSSDSSSDTEYLECE